MRRLILLLLPLILLAACGALPETVPTELPTSTPDIYQLALGNI